MTLVSLEGCDKARWAALSRSSASNIAGGRPKASTEVKVKKLTVATDVGTQVHPDNIRAQVEGAALSGLSLAMYEKATLKDGGIEQTNFDSYTPLRMSQVPEVAADIRLLRIGRFGEEVTALKCRER